MPDTNDRAKTNVLICHSCCFILMTLQWRHNERDGVSNHQRLDCLFNRLFRRRSKKTSKLHTTGLCEGNPPVTGGFASQKTSNVDVFSIWWRHRESKLRTACLFKRVACNTVHAMEIQKTSFPECRACIFSMRRNWNATFHQVLFFCK